MINCIFTRSQCTVHHFQKFKKYVNRQAVKNVLKIESVLLSALLPSYLVILLANF